MGLCDRLSKGFSPRRYLDNQIFVSLANGELVAYQREAGEARSGPPKGAGGVKCSPKVAAVGWVPGQPSRHLRVLAASLPPWEGKGHPSSDAEDPKIRARWIGPVWSWSLPAPGISWGHQLTSPLTGDLEMGISSHHIPSAGSRWGFLGML